MAFSGQYRLKKHSLKTNFNCIKWLNEISITHPDMPRQTPLRTNGYVQTERTAAERVSHTGLQRVSKIWLLLSWRLPATVGPTLNPQSRKNAFAGKAPAAFGVLREEQRAYPPAAAFAFGVPQEQKRGCYATRAALRGLPKLPGKKNACRSASRVLRTGRGACKGKALSSL